MRGCGASHSGVCGVLALAMLTLVAESAALADETSATIVGCVIDRAGSPIARAKLTVEAWRSAQKIVARGESDSVGRFVIPRVSVGVRQMLVIDAEGFGRDYRDDVFTFAGRTTDVGEIRLGSGCVARGRVLDAAGKPAAEVSIKVEVFRHQLGHTIEAFGGNYNITTDEKGLFVTPPLPVAFVMFRIMPPPGSVDTAPPVLNISPLDHELDCGDIRLEREVPLEGTVYDTLGNPVAGAKVWHSVFHEVVRTDPLGRFSLRGCSETMTRKVPLSVSAEGYAEHFEHDAERTLPHRVILRPCLYVAGQAIDVESGEPVKIDKVVVCEVTRDADGTPRSYGCGEARFTLNAAGRFQAVVSEPGEKHLTIMAAGYQHGETYGVEPGLALEALPMVTVKMRRAGSTATVARQQIRGVVRASGSPVEGAWVSLWLRRPELDAVNAAIKRGRTIPHTYRPNPLDVQTATDGSYLLDIVDPREYYVVVQLPDGRTASSEPIELKAAQQQTCDIDAASSGTITGRVTGLDEKTAEGLYVIAFGRTPYLAHVPIERDGSFVLKSVPPGEIGLKVGHEGYLDDDVMRYPYPKDAGKVMSEPWKRAVTVSVRSGERVSGVELELPKPGPADGKWKW